MTQVMNTSDSTVDGASGEDGVALQVERFPKFSSRVPCIVVEPTDGGEVESGELRWPPDDVSSDVRESHAQVKGVPVEEVQPEKQVMGGV